MRCLFTALLAAACLAGCASPAGREDTTPSVESATVVAVRVLPGRAEGSGVQVSAGVGVSVSGGSSSLRDPLALGVLGVVAGLAWNRANAPAAPPDATRDTVELTVKLASGEQRQWVLPPGHEVFQPGETVLIVHKGQRVRVTHPLAPVAPPPTLAPSAASAPPAAEAAVPATAGASGAASTPR